MGRYRTYGPRDDQPLTEGDLAITGFSSRIQPSALGEGTAAYLGNMRCDRGTTKVRRGPKALCTDIALSSPPLILDFTLAPDVEVASVTRSGSTATVTTAAAHGYSTADIVNVRGAVQAEYNGDHIIAVTGGSSFTFAVSGTPASPATGTILANRGPLIANVYSDQVHGSCKYSNFENVEGLMLATTTRAFLYREGLSTLVINYPASETVVAGDPCFLWQFIGKVYLFRGTAKVPLSWDLDPTHDFVLVSQTALSGTLVPMPPADWGIDFKERFILPYGRDQGVLSDIGDAETYDSVFAQFRIRQGSADWLVFVHPYQEARLLVLYRESVHVLVLDGSDLSISQIFDITGVVGCVARKSVQTCGNTVLWLSDAGVSQMDVSSELNLRGSQLPLSDPIQDQFDAINWAAAEGAVAAYFNNRYYLAVPANGATMNNVVLVYNFINAKWESVDTFPGDFDVRDFHIIDYAGRKRLHAVSTYGLVFVMEELEVDEWGTPSAIGQYAIAGSIVTRSYRNNTFELKRFRRAQLETNLGAGDAFAVSFRASNPTAAVAVLNHVAAMAGAVTHRMPLGPRGVTGQIAITTTAGRPEFKTVLVEATELGRRTEAYA